MSEAPTSGAGEARAADGARIRYLDEGQGPPIVVVHPGSSDVDSWRGVGASLSWAFRVLRIERRLYARGGPPAAHSVALEVQDVHAVLSVLREPALLVGHSSGAVVALEAALHAPSALAGLVLYEPPVAVTEPLGGDS